MGNMDFIKQSKSGLLIPSHSYKPFRYPWAFDFWKKQQQVHWMPEEVPLGEDCKDWATNLNDNERNLCLLYTSPSPRVATLSRMPSSA